MKEGELSRRRDEHEQQFFRFLQGELEMCHTLIGIFDTEQRVGNAEAAGRALANAEKGYATAVRFLSDPKHRLNRENRQVIESGVVQLREALDQARQRAR